MGLMLETLRPSLAAVIAKHGKDAPSARDLQSQIDSLERQARQRDGTEQPRENPVSFRGQFRGLIPRYVLTVFGQWIRMINRASPAFADNSLLFVLSP